MAKKENIVLNRDHDPYLTETFREVDPRVFIRDYYANTFKKQGVLAYLAYQDYDLLSGTISRLEVIEYIAFGLEGFPKFVMSNEEEKKYLAG